VHIFKKIIYIKTNNVILLLESAVPVSRYLRISKMTQKDTDSGSPSNATGTTCTEHPDSSAKDLFDLFWGDYS
jgi:hypothetical protein